MMRKWLIYILMVGFTGLIFPSLLFAADKETKAPPTLKAQPVAASNEEGYLIGPGDVLEISVWKDEALTKQPTVRPDGFISFPLVGDIHVAGKTVSQLRTEMEKKLVNYVPDIVLSVDIKQINSMTIFIIGKVNQPGRFNTSSYMNVLQALATAGGLNTFAKRSAIKIFREESGKTKMFPFDYDDVVDGKHLEQNIRLKRGDIVVIP